MDDQTKPRKAAQAAAPAIDPVPRVTPSTHEFVVPDDAFNTAIYSNPNTPAKSVNAHNSSAWIQGPGAIQLLVEASKDLLQVAGLREKKVKQVRFVKLVILEAIKTILVIPAFKKDTHTLEVTWKKGQASFNASDDLINADLQVESGRRERFQVHVVPTTKVGPALAIDMNAIVDVRNVTKRSSAAKGKGKQGETPDDDDLDLDEE